jgi:hypothetical protein
MEMSDQLQVSAALPEKQNLYTYREPNCDLSAVQSTEPSLYWAIPVQGEYTAWRQLDIDIDISQVNLLKTKRNLFYIMNQLVLRSKHFPLRL